MKYLHLTLRQPRETRHPMQNAIADHEAIHRADLLCWNFGTGEDEESLLFYVVGDDVVYEAALADVESVVDYDVTSVDDDTFYVYVDQRTRETDVDFRAAFARRRLVVVPPVVYTDDGETAFTVVGDAEDLRATLDALPNRIDVDVDQVGEYDRRNGALTGSLTARQREAVAVAVDRGYYDVPRTGSVEAVATELGVSSSTASSHLRKAEATVMRRVARR
ncbi:Predicted DNA binding protein, contains HTH domain [Halogranum amylolyticum]|uniref:Predicted DNA binding protein, contains HTH domain n=1 Tax=Halogranum amylolyticum TaxID=660520 RepID=A0A1H8RV01_9EURY|nr:helix-turn-helix domain-containing protein [Halogranum amylolyticum]SEO70175.1 Predicted DNA binding protein, contains HTH domain [Halogranum amylolyticum]